MPRIPEEHQEWHYQGYCAGVDDAMKEDGERRVPLRRIASARTRAVSLAVHAAGLTLYTAIKDGDSALPESILETLPTYYGRPNLDEPLAPGDVAGLIEARNKTNEALEGRTQVGRDYVPEPERIALATMDAALILLGISPHAEREPLSQGIPRSNDHAKMTVDELVAALTARLREDDVDDPWAAIMARLGSNDRPAAS